MASANDVLLRLLASPEIASKRIVWRQYDHQVGTDTVVGPGSDAAVVRIKGTKKALAIATDGNAAYTHLDPYTGGAIAVCEAARNVACTGARPLAMTNCLNFGNPEKPDVYWQLSEAIRGMADAAKALGIPVISGNVSLYNETNGEPIWPTPVVGVVGLIEDVDRAVPMGFQDAGDVVALLVGHHERFDGATYVSALAGSQYAALTSRAVLGRPRIDLKAEQRMHRFLREATDRNLIKSMHDVSSGGLAVALAECCIARDVGCEMMIQGERDDVNMFGELGGVLVSTHRFDELEELADRHEVVVAIDGEVGGTSLTIGGQRSPRAISLTIDELRSAYESGLPRALESAPVTV